jgi:hypothetical protein
VGRNRSHRRAALALRSEATNTSSKAYSIDPGAGGGVLDFISGASANVEKMLNAAESYWFWANCHPYLGAAARMISDSLSSEGYEIVNPSNTRDQDSIDNDPKVQGIKTILDLPNNDQKFADLIGEISLDVDVTARAYVHILRMGSTMTGLERIDARTCGPHLSRDSKSIDKFMQKIRSENGMISYVDYNPADIIFFKSPGGADITGGPSLIELLDLTLAVDYGARKHNAAYFRNGAKAGTIIIGKKMDQRQMGENKAAVEASKTGPDNAYRTLYLAGEFDVHQPATGDDESFGKSMDRALTDVSAVYRVPESMLKNAEGALGQAGKENDERTYHEECVTPRARRIMRTLSRRILEDEFHFDPLELELRPKSRYAIRVSMIPNAILLLQAGGTINESRQLINLPKSGLDADLDRPYVLNTVTQIQTEEEKQQAAQQVSDQADQAQQNSMESAAQAHAHNSDASAQDHQQKLEQISAQAKASGSAKAPTKPPPAKKAADAPNPRRSGRFSNIGSGHQVGS